MIRTPRFRKIAMALLVVAFATACSESSERSAEWLTGPAFAEKLTLPATVLWSDSPFREHLLDFGRVQGVAILLDRRVDPDQLLTLAVRNEPVLTVVQAAANSRGLKAAVLRNLIYVARPEDAEQIRTVAELRRQEIDAIGRDAALKFARQAPMKWPDFQEPKNLLRDLARDNEIEIVNLDQVPHDLWPAADMPPMSLTERLTLILHQFRLTFQVAEDGRRIAVVPLPLEVAVVRDYPGGAKPDTLAEKWHAECPDSEFRVVGSRIYVRGLLEDHEKIGRLRTPGGRHASKPRASRKSDPPLDQVFTAEVPNRPLGAVLAHFAKQLGLELHVDEASLKHAGVSLEQLISFRVENATFDELFRAVLEPVGCEYERQGNVLTIRAKK